MRTVKYALAFALLSSLGGLVLGQHSGSGITYGERYGHPVPAASHHHSHDDYIGGVGLVTLSGPTGLFINPTSGTVGKGNTSLQYCFYLPTVSDGFEPSLHGLAFSYGFTDAFEFGLIMSYIDDRRTASNSSSFSVGPQARYRIVKDRGPNCWIPEVSVVGYGRFGDGGGGIPGIGGGLPLQGLLGAGGDVAIWGIAPVAFKRFPVSRYGLVRSIGIHAGVRYENNSAFDSPHHWNGYAGFELELPLSLYVVGEIATQEEDRGETNVPYAYGVQWRRGALGMTVATMDAGSILYELYYGVGLGFQF